VMSGVESGRCWPFLCVERGTAVCLLTRGSAFFFVSLVLGVCKRKSKSPEPAFVVVVVVAAAAAAANQCFLGPTTTPTHLVRCGLRKSGYCPFSKKKARSKGRSRLRAAI
jgi:hypothetical protein